MADEQITNRNDLTDNLSVYTSSPMSVGRPPKPEAERRSKLFPLRLTPGELAEYEQAARSMGETVADILRKGAAIYIQRGKDGPKRKERK